ncbi:hypothetical protein IC582_009326 [Cucumis melo]
MKYVKSSEVAVGIQPEPEEPIRRFLKSIEGLQIHRNAAVLIHTEIPIRVQQEMNRSTAGNYLSFCLQCSVSIINLTLPFIKLRIKSNKISPQSSRKQSI